MTKNKLFTLSCINILIWITIDQITKIWAFGFIDSLATPYKQIEVTSFFNIVKVWNTGISFGMLRNWAYSNLALSIVVICITLFIFKLLWQSKAKYESFTFSIIIAGAIGNLIDRFRLGAVADFLDFHLGTHHWPAFNIADSLVCIGICLIIIQDLFLKKSKKH